MAGRRHPGLLRAAPALFPLLALLSAPALFPGPAPPPTWALASAPAGAAATTSEPPAAELAEILERLGRVARLYRDTALRFTCHEVIEEWQHGSSTAARFEFDYVYVYSDLEGLMDYRLGLERGRKREVRLQTVGIGQFLERAYSWAFLFNPAVQAHFHYTLAAPEVVLGRDALRIEFTPLPPYRRGLNDWAGSAWIDARTYQILRVEALQPKDYEVRRRLRERLAEVVGLTLPRRPERFVYSQFVTDFSVERNGQRFPGGVEIVHSAWTTAAERGEHGVRETPILRVEQTYSDYRFFSVRTEEEILELVFGSKAPPAGRPPL